MNSAPTLTTPRCSSAHKREKGECRSCRKCLECCGRVAVKGSCQERDLKDSAATRGRRARGLEAYWRSVDAGRQKR
jgi:hypothetical protein